MSLRSLATEVPLREKVPEEEWRARVDLAACYRLVALYGMTDLTMTHISARVPGEENAFLINPMGFFFDEITASSLVKVDHDGKILSETVHDINEAGYVIHSAIHAAREDVGSVLHTHTRAGMAVAAMACGLLPISQHAMRFYKRLGYHDYEGIALDIDERQRLVADLGAHRAMILKNHGLLTAGRSTAEAFNLMFYLEKCCQSQIDAMTGGAEIVVPSEAVCEHAAGQFEGFGVIGNRDWPGHLRRLDKLHPSYRQ
jgi:ribulose-5-phosphate 4-epimerase/fuculose-1-phosphate aldolase